MILSEWHLGVFCGDFLAPLLWAEAEVVDALARQQRDQVWPCQSEEFGGLA